MQMTDIIKLAIVGAGLVGQRHINAIAKQKDVVLVAIVEPNPSEDIKAMDVPCFDTLEKMFLLISPDGVILSTPTPLEIFLTMKAEPRSLFLTAITTPSKG